jgi:hypothetical protein
MSVDYHRQKLPLSATETVLGLAVASESASLAASTFTSVGLWVFAASFGLMVLMLPLFLSREAERGGTVLPSLLMSVLVASSAFLAVAVLVPAKKEAPSTQFVSDLGTTFPIPLNLAEDVRKHGTERAMSDLQTMAAKDPDISSQSHQIAHAIGELSVRHYSTPGEALSHCTNDFQSGCIHGVVVSYLDSTDDPGAFVKMCARDQIKGSDFLRFNCLHGLGHAALSLAQYNLQQALDRCDTLGAEWDASSCYGGVFMENVVTLWEGNDFLTTYSPDDHLYPCTGLADRYQLQCYLMQSSVILILNHYNFAEAFTECDSAPSPYLAVCYMSLGREVSGYTLRSAPESLKMCGLARAEMQESCLVGVVKNFIDFFGRIDEGVALCAMAGPTDQRGCYYAVGEEVGVLSADLRQRAADCQKVASAFIDACLAGARVE